MGAWLMAPGAAHASEHPLEIDISEQVLAEVVDGRVVDAIHVSTGSGEGYWPDGAWWDGETPRGSFQIHAKDPGWVEDYPASHGCVRVTIADADALFQRIAIGTPVLVHD